MNATAAAVRLPARLPAAVLCLLAVWLSMLPAWAEAPEARATLSIHGNQTRFKAGEPVQLDLSIEALRPGVMVSGRDSLHPPVDQLVVTPALGVHDWLAEWERAQPSQHDVIARHGVPTGRERRFVLTLNQVYRFDRAGHYTVRLTTRRTGSELSSNEVSFDIDLPGPDEEAAQARDLLREIRAARTPAQAQQAADRLNWLPGEAATRIKLALLLQPALAGPCVVNVQAGLWIARDRVAIVGALEQALVDPAQVLNVRDAVLDTLVSLKTSLDAHARPPELLQREAILEVYLHRIALTLPQRSGESLINAARLVFTRASTSGEALQNPDVQAAREVLIEHFDEIDPYLIEPLLGRQGRQLEDPRMAAVLRRALDRPLPPEFSSTRAAMLRLLGRLQPASLPPYVVREACSERPAALAALRDLPTDRLPAVDACLRRKLSEARPATASFAQNYALGQTLAYTARFASPALQHEVAALLPALEGPNTQEAYGGALAYLLRLDTARYLPLLRAAMDRPDSPPWLYHFSQALHRPAEGLLAFLRQGVAEGPAARASQAITMLAELGGEEDRQFLLEQLRLLQARLRTHQAEGADDGRKESDLVFALIQGRHWADIPSSHLADGCVSPTCKTSFRRP